MKKNIWLTSLLTLIVVHAHADQTNPSHSLFGFDNQTILSISDADMIASAYTNGKLGPKEGRDVLSMIEFNQQGNNYKLTEVPASNSVAGPPAALAVDPKGQYAYIIETFTPRPDNNLPHTFADLAPGNQLTVYKLQNKQRPTLIATHQIPKRPDSINVSHDGEWLVISFYPSPDHSQKPIGLYKINKGNIINEYYPELPQWNPQHRLIFSSWHPSQDIFSVINQTSAEVSFFHFQKKDQTIKQWGNTVSVGKSPFIGRFSQNGKHFLVNNLFWGADVQGKWNEAPNGTIVNITLDAESQGAHSPTKKVRHALSSQVMVGPSPEGFALSPKGDFVVSANMERSWLPHNDSRQSSYSSLSLIKRDPNSGAMKVLHTYPYDGILPESLIFSPSGQYLAVTTFDHYNVATKGGSIDFFKLVSDPLNTHQTMIMKMRDSIAVTRGPHSMVLLHHRSK